MERFAACQTEPEGAAIRKIGRIVFDFPAIPQCGSHIVDTKTALSGPILIEDVRLRCYKPILEMKSLSSGP